MDFQTIPVLRIFDETKAREFYLDFLGMHVDWEHRFGPNDPLYMQVSRDDLVFHLSEHSGDCTPGAKVFVSTEGLQELQRELSETDYRYCRPDLDMAPWGDRIVEVTDPFMNRILFNERTTRRQ